MPSLMTVAAPVLAVGALLAPGCQPGCAPAENRALVWEADDPSWINATDPQPSFGAAAADQTTLRITKLLWVNPGAPGNVSDECDAEIAAYAAQFNEDRQPYCLYVETVMTADDASTGQVVDGPMIRTDGNPTVGCCLDELSPGESRLAGTYYPGVGPGALLQWDVATGGTVVTHQYVVPASETFQPFTWDL